MGSPRGGTNGGEPRSNRDGSKSRSGRDGSKSRSGRDGSDGTTGVRARRRVAVFALVVLIVSVIPLPGASVPGGGTSAFPFGIGLTVPFHLLGYAVLAWLLTGVAGRHPRGLVAAATLATGYGFGIEIVQTVVPWRSFAWTDVLLNALGAAVGTVMAAAGRTSTTRFRRR